MDSIEPTTVVDALDIESEDSGWDKLVRTHRDRLGDEAVNGSAYDLDQVYLHPNTPSRIVTLEHHNILGWSGFTLGAAFVAAILIPTWSKVVEANNDMDSRSLWAVLPLFVGMGGLAIWVWFCTGLASKVFGAYQVYSSRHAMIVRYRYQRAVHSLRESAKLGVENAAAAADAADKLAVVLADLTNQESNLKDEHHRTDSYHWEYRERLEAVISEVRGVTVGLIAPVIAASELAHSKRGNLVLDMSDLCDAPVELDLSRFGLTAEQQKVVSEATAVLAELSRS